MEYFYLDNNNNKVKLNLAQNTDLSKLKIDNKQLNSVFSKIDINNDGILQENELDLVNKLFKKADTLAQSSANNGVLENDELQALNEQIENGQIKLPQKQNTNNDRQWVEQRWVQISGRTPEEKESFHSSILKEISKKYPSSQYYIEEEPYGTGTHFNIYPKEGVPKTLNQTTSIIRTDGKTIEIKDFLNSDVTNDDNGPNKLEYQSAALGNITISDKNGAKHKISYRLNDCHGRDAVDCRRMRDIVADFLANLPEDKINQLIENGITEINFESGEDITEEDYLPEYYQKYKSNIDKYGYFLDISEDYAAIISPTFTLPKREYTQTHTIERDDGFKFQLNDTSDSSSALKAKTPSGETFSINIDTALDTDTFHQWQLPKLRQMLSELPETVLNDLKNEVDSIQFMSRSNIGGNGIYALGSNTIAFKADSDENTPTISFVHELGHAIDNQNGIMYSKTPKFNNKFDEFTGLMAKLGINGNHSTDNSCEFFASVYAYQALPGDESQNNHIKFLNESLEKFKESDNPDERRCYELFQELQNDVRDFVGHVRKQPKSVRADNTVKELVKKECKDLIEEMDKYSEADSLIGQSTLLELTQTLSLDDEDFENTVKHYERMSLEDTQGASIFPEVRELYAKMATRMRELRPKIKQ